ncbi:glycosyltransferase family 25 protein [Psychrobacter sp. T6-1]|uniref:glycosyltransferase family 25 protein n=1 Tax=Psychrobacter sp. T6-1 TaxID=3457447 RepID=UPI003FCF2A7B
MTIPIQILVINLKSSTERKARISEQLNNLDIPYEFLEATEGSVLTDEWIESNIDDRLKNIYYNKLHYSVNKNALACADSHRRAQLIARGLKSKYTLILEDDVELSSDFKKKVTNTIGLMREHSLHVAFLGYNLSKGKCTKKKNINSKFGFSFFNYPIEGHVSGAYSYIVDSVGADLIVRENLEKIQDTADTFYIEEKGLIDTTVVLYPKLVTTGYLESDIGGHVNSKLSTIKKAKRVVYSLALKSNTTHGILRYWKERRW